MRSLKGKRVVITGASRGIGEGIARLFAGDGCRLVICGRDEVRLSEVASSLDLSAEDVVTVTCDITEPSGMKAIIDTAWEKLGGVDIFVNNAGVGAAGQITEIEPDEFDRVFDTNLKAVYYCFHELIPRMKKQGQGQIINISSMAGKQGVPGLAVYSASKAALNALSEGVAGEVRNDNIKISVLAPGSTDTGFMSDRSGKQGASHRAKIRLLVADVAEAVLFLARQNENAWMSLAEIRPLITKRG